MTCRPLTPKECDEMREKYWPKDVTYPPIHLWTDLKYVYVSIQVDGKWIEVIREIHDSPFSHIVEPGGIEQCIRAAKETAAEQRLQPRPSDQRSEPDNHVRCAFCDSGFLPGEVFEKPRECCVEGNRADSVALNR